MSAPNHWQQVRGQVWTGEKWVEPDDVPKKKPKYGSKPRNVDGLTREECESLGLKWTKFYDSGREAEGHWGLKKREEQGEIADLQWQPRFPIVVNGVKICVYIADAEYIENGIRIIHDFKGMRTPVYRLKARLVQALYGVKVRET